MRSDEHEYFTGTEQAKHRVSTESAQSQHRAWHNDERAHGRRDVLERHEHFDEQRVVRVSPAVAMQPLRRRARLHLRQKQ